MRSVSGGCVDGGLNNPSIWIYKLFVIWVTLISPVKVMDIYCVDVNPLHCTDATYVDVTWHAEIEFKGSWWFVETSSDHCKEDGNVTTMLPAIGI